MLQVSKRVGRFLINFGLRQESYLSIQAFLKLFRVENMYSAVRWVDHPHPCPILYHSRLQWGWAATPLSSISINPRIHARGWLLIFSKYLYVHTSQPDPQAPPTGNECAHSHPYYCVSILPPKTKRVLKVVKRGRTKGKNYKHKMYPQFMGVLMP